MADHDWVKMLCVKVNVIPSMTNDSSGHQVMLEDDIEQAIDNAVVGCINCNLPLNDETIHTKCDPPSTAKSIRAAFRWGFNRGKRV